MKTLIASITLATALATTLATGAQADCYADYKAKQDDPLRLHYGIMADPRRHLSPRQQAAAQISAPGFPPTAGRC